MGYFAESFAELYNADGWIDMGMYIGAGSSAPFRSPEGPAPWS